MLSSRNTPPPTGCCSVPFANAVASASPDVCQQHSDRFEPLRMSRRQQQQRVRIASHDLAEAVEQHRLFALQRAARHQHRTDLLPFTAAANGSRICGLSGGLTSNFRFPPTWTRSAGAPICTSRRASSSLCARNTSTFLHHAFEQLAEAQISWQGPVRHPRVDHGNRCSRKARLVQEVWPELALRQH